MTDSQKYSVVGKDNSVVEQIVTVDITTTTVANTVPCAAVTFDRSYSAVPYVKSAHAPRASSVANAIATSVGLTAWVRGFSDAKLADGTLEVTVVVEGRLV